MKFDCDPVVVALFEKRAGLFGRLFRRGVQAAPAAFTQGPGVGSLLTRGAGSAAQAAPSMLSAASHIPFNPWISAASQAAPALGSAAETAAPSFLSRLWGGVKSFGVPVAAYGIGSTAGQYGANSDAISGQVNQFANNMENMPWTQRLGGAFGLLTDPKGTAATMLGESAKQMANNQPWYSPAGNIMRRTSDRLRAEITRAGAKPPALAAPTT